MHVSAPALDAVLERVRARTSMSQSAMVSMYRTQVGTLLDAIGVDARVLVRRSAVHEPPRFSGRGWDDFTVMLAECAEQTASEAVVRLLNLIANRLGAAGELPGGDNRRRRHG